MVRSLKEGYEARRLQVLKERVKIVDEQLLREQHATYLIVEAMDDEDLKKVTAIVQKLSKIKGSGIKSLTAAIEKAEAELNKYTAGGPLTAVWTKIKSKVGLDNPVVKVATFADALERGFSQIPQILKNNGIDISDLNTPQQKEQTLAQIIAKQNEPKTGKASEKDVFGKKSSGDTTPPLNAPNVSDFSSNQSVQNEADNDKPVSSSKLKSIVAQLTKALSPGGIYGAFRKVPYVRSAELAQELINVPLRVFSNVANTINSGSKAAEIAPDIKANVTGHGEVQTLGAKKEDPTKDTTQTQPAEPTKTTTTSSGSTPTGETTPGPQKAGGGEPGSNEKYRKAKSKIVPVVRDLRDANKLDQVVKSLVDAGLDPDKLQF